VEKRGKGGERKETREERERERRGEEKERRKREGEKDRENIQYKQKHLPKFQVHL
jgi:hypothetical protein